MNGQLLLCTDLDRAVLPNGSQSESAGARTLFAVLEGVVHYHPEVRGWLSDVAAEVVARD